MLFMISSPPDTKEFNTACRMAKDINAEICLLQDAVFAARNGDDKTLYVMSDDLKLRGISENEISCKAIDYGRLVDLMMNADKVVGIF